MGALSPSVLTVGDTGPGRPLDRTAGSRCASPRVDLTETVGHEQHVAHLDGPIAHAPANRSRPAIGCPRSRRGRARPSGRRCGRAPRSARAGVRPATIGAAESRGDRRSTDVRPADAIARQRRARPPPARQTIAQRIGPGEFHSLREYVTGDEPRSIHWRASARSRGPDGSPTRGTGRPSMHRRARPRR